MSIAAAGLVLGVVGTVVQGVASYQQASYQAAVAKMNAKINEQNAERAAYASQIEAQDKGFQNRFAIGAEIADQASSGLSLGSGSFALRRKSLRELSTLDQQRLVQQGDVESYNFKVAAANDRAQAGLYQSQATGALVGIPFNAASSFINNPYGKSLVSGALTTRKG